MIDIEHLKRSILSLKKKVRGQNLVELTLILPIVMVLFAGMVEVGFAVHSYVVVSSAAREGARFGARGVHVPFDDIVTIVETGLGKVIAPSFYGPDMNASIIVTEVDIEEDGSYTIHSQDKLGDLAVSSSVCEPSAFECPSGSLDIQDFIDANTSFNDNPEFCVETLGCDGDFVVVEVFYNHKSVVLSGFTRDLIPDPFPIEARAVMRVLHRRSPLS
jgi:hypothetical protein